MNHRSARAGGRPTSRTSAAAPAPAAPGPPPRVEEIPSMLGGLAADVDLNANVERRQTDVAGHRETLRDLVPIDRLHPREAPRRGPCLVALQGPYKVPFDSREPGQRGDLGPCLLNVVFSKRALSQRIRGSKGLDREAFAHRENSNRARL